MRTLEHSNSTQALFVQRYPQAVGFTKKSSSSSGVAASGTHQDLRQLFVIILTGRLHALYFIPLTLPAGACSPLAPAAAAGFVPALTSF